MLLQAVIAEPYKNALQLAQLVANVCSAAAVCFAAAWFIRTSKYRQRIQFDLELKTHLLPSNSESLVAEIQFIFENKGFVEHRIYNLTVSVHSLESEEHLEVKSTSKELEFAKAILPRTDLVPPKYKFYFIRPGVRQVITHILPIEASSSVVRVTAGFQYDRRGEYPHTVRRVFSTKPPEKIS